MEFEFATAGRIIFGRGTLSRSGTIASEHGKRVLIVTGRNSRRADRLLPVLKDAGVEGPVFATPGEPDLETVRKGRRLAMRERCQVVLAIGGGSAIDAGKAVAVLAANEGDVLDYLEVIGRGMPLRQPSLPFIAIPTTAGTGSEVTRNAVLASAEHGVKASLRSGSMLPKVALVDPELSDELPSHITATTGLDALTQLIEAFVCSRANPFTDGLCREGIRMAARALPVVTGPEPTQNARDDMALAALFSGLALANAGLGAVHGLAGPIGGMFPAPHGAVCAILLGPVLETNRRALTDRASGSMALAKFDELPSLLGQSPEATPEEAIHWIRTQVKQLKIPPLREYGLKEEHVPELMEKALKASSMKANPVALTREELRNCLAEAL